MDSEDWRELNETRKAQRRERMARAEVSLSDIRRDLAHVGVSVRTPSPHHWQFFDRNGSLIGSYWPSTMKAQPASGSVHHGVTITQIVNWVRNRV